MASAFTSVSLAWCRINRQQRNKSGPFKHKTKRTDSAGHTKQTYVSSCGHVEVLQLRHGRGVRSGNSRHGSHRAVTASAITDAAVRLGSSGSSSYSGSAHQQLLLRSHAPLTEARRAKSPTVGEVSGTPTGLAGEPMAVVLLVLSYNRYSQICTLLRQTD